MIQKLKFYARCVKWLYRHRNCANTRQKYRRMQRELGKDGFHFDELFGNAEQLKGEGNDKR